MVLDSDIMIYFLKGEREIVKEVLAIPEASLMTTRINYTELLYGAYHSAKVEKNLSTMLDFLQKFQILEFDAQAAKIFAITKAKLKKSGEIIADMDLMIASIALANDETLFTNNLKHFARIEGLRIKTV